MTIDQLRYFIEHTVGLTGQLFDLHDTDVEAGTDN